MKLDVVFVTYNSVQWIKNNFDSILSSKYDLKNISLYYYDNNSSDNTVEELEKLNKQYSKKFNNFKIISGTKNKGFGFGNNRAAKLGKSEYILFLNIDTEIKSDTFSKIEKEINNASKEVGIFELRQKPYEHPKYYDPITGYTSWASGACMIVKRSLYERVHGFDSKIFMYCEDVELSWKIRKLGYEIKYMYDIPITHYSYTSPNEFKENQFIFGFINNLYLRSKYGNIKNVIKGHYLCFKLLKFNMATNYLTNDQYKKLRKKCLKEYLKAIPKCILARFYKHTHKGSKNFKPQFVNDLDYEIPKLDPFYVQKDNFKSKSLVSIIVRTCGRPTYLRETLMSLRNQTYQHIEVVVVEDGENVSENMIKSEFSDLNIQYKATGKKVGRSAAGNIGMTIASGKYLNFLDDDDLFYPDHVQTLVYELETNNLDIVYSTAFETAIEVVSKDPYKYIIKDKMIRFFGHFSRLKLYQNNITPIQSVMFKKEVFENCGGLDENIDALEDWDLWLRFSLKYNFNYVEKTTSIYRVPYNNSISNERQKFLNSSLDYLTKKHANNKVELNIFDIFWNHTGE